MKKSGVSSMLEWPRAKCHVPSVQSSHLPEEVGRVEYVGVEIDGVALQEDASSQLGHLLYCVLRSSRGSELLRYLSAHSVHSQFIRSIGSELLWYLSVHYLSHHYAQPINEAASCSGTYHFTHLGQLKFSSKTR